MEAAWQDCTAVICRPRLQVPDRAWVFEGGEALGVEITGALGEEGGERSCLLPLFSQEDNLWSLLCVS